MATYEARGKRIRAKIRLDGVEDSKTFANKTDARAWATKREAEIQAGLVGRTHDAPFSALLNRFKEHLPDSRRNDKIRLTRIIRDDAIAQVNLRDLNATHIADWRNARLKKVSAASVLREWNVLSPACSLAVAEWHWLAVNPFKGVKRPTPPVPRYRRVSPEEIALVKYVSGYDQGVSTKTARVAAMFLFCIETMMRCGEARCLRPQDIDLEGHNAYVAGAIGAKKTDNTIRDVPLSIEAERILRQVNCAFDVGTAAQVDGIWRKLTTDAGLENLHFHDSRHEAITRNARYMDVLDLARAAGLGDLNMLRKVYYNPTPSEIAHRFRRNQANLTMSSELSTG